MQVVGCGSFNSKHSNNNGKTVGMRCIFSFVFGTMFELIHAKLDLNYENLDLTYIQ